MFKSNFLVLFFCLFSSNTSFASLNKEWVDKNYKDKMNKMRYYLPSQCLTTLDPLIKGLQSSHDLFLKDKPLDAILQNLELIHDKLPRYKNSGCALNIFVEAMMYPVYMWYYLEVNSQYEATPYSPRPTDFEKTQIVNVAYSISNKVNSMCLTITCDEYPKNVIRYSEQIIKEMQSENPDYFKILKSTNSIKQGVNFAFNFNKKRDKKYYEALNWVVLNMGYLYRIPKKYLFDLPEYQDFRHYIAADYVEHLMKYTDMNDALNPFKVSLFSSYLYWAVQNNNLDALLVASQGLYKDYYSLANLKITNAAWNEYISYIVNWYNDEVMNFFKLYYEKHKQ